MDPVEHSIRIDAPVDTVWRVMTEIDVMPQRLRHVVETERLSGPPFSVGTRWRHKARPQHEVAPGRPAPEIETQIEVIGCEPGLYFVTSMPTLYGRAVQGYELNALSTTQCEVRTKVTVQATGFGSRFMLWLVRRTLARMTGPALDRLLKELKRAAEQLHRAH